MKVLVACEYSGRVRDAFIKAGHEALSCDLLPTERQGPHHQGDVRDVLFDGWDLVIAHPPCTYLTCSAEWCYKDEQTKKIKPGVLSSRWRKPDQIIQPWMFGDDASKRTCLWTQGLPNLTPTKIIPPKGWSEVMFAADVLDLDENGDGDPTCSIHGQDYAECPCIGPTEDDVTYKEEMGALFGTRENPAPPMRWGNQTPGGYNKLPPSEDRWKLRSLTYHGIADAMAEQWG